VTLSGVRALERRHARADLLLFRWLERLRDASRRDRRRPIARGYWRKRDARADVFPGEVSPSPSVVRPAGARVLQGVPASALAGMTQDPE